jgi:hypothetical protein
MSPIDAQVVERRLGSALAQRADAVAIPTTADGRAAIDGRVRLRARRRRSRRVIASIAVVALLVAGFAWSRHGGEANDKVAVVPGQPAVPLPKVGLTGRGEGWELAGYSPDRWELLYLRSSADRRDGLLDLVIAPDASAGVNLPTAPGTIEIARVRGVSAVVVAIPSSSHGAAVIWEIAPGVKALLRTDDVAATPGLPLRTTLDRATAARLLAVANRIGPVPDSAWWRAVSHFGSTSGGFDIAVPPVLTGQHGHTEIGLIQPGAFEPEWFDAPGFTPGSLFAEVKGGGGPGTIPKSVPGPARIVEVRGTRGIWLPASSLDPHPRLEWTERGLFVTLVSSAAPASGQGSADRLVAAADAMSVPTAAEWHALLSPATVRTDLVPMPTDVFTQWLAGPQQHTFQGHGTEITTTTTR